MLCRKVRQGLVVLLMLLVPAVAPAVTAQAEEEITCLLDAIAASNCRFIRNGVEYDAGEAHRHILRKYGYAKPWINTAEDFIRDVASRSSMSGEPYRIRCSGQTVALADWLRAVLAEFRRSKAPDGSTEAEHP
jgi:hypothetical protein